MFNFITKSFLGKYATWNGTWPNKSSDTNELSLHYCCWGMMTAVYQVIFAILLQQNPGSEGVMGQLFGKNCQLIYCTAM